MKAFYRRRLKRVLDILASAVGILLAAPFMAITAFIVWCEFGSPVLFRQERIGFGGRRFTVTKFRTMSDATDAAGGPAPDAVRLTPVGKFLRKLSLDELPQLFHVLKGDMSLIGPRPLLPEYLPHYSERQATRHNMRPGITGLAQVCGRNATTWESRLEHDARYVERVSPGLDLWILLKTAHRLVAPVGVSALGHSTMPRFDESPSQELLIIGAGGHGKVVAEAALAVGLQPILLDDDASKQNAVMGGCKVQGTIRDAFKHPRAKAIIALGDNGLRRDFAERLGLDWISIIHPSAVVSKTAKIEPGAFVAANAVIGPDARIDRHAIVNTSAVVDHDVVIGAFSHIAPGAVLTGGVCVGEEVLIGAGATTIPCLHIGDRATVGAGAVVVRDLPCGVVAVGTPARPIRISDNSRTEAAA